MTKFKATKTLKIAKNEQKSSHFWVIKAKKSQIQNWIPKGCGYSNTLESTKEKVVGSFQLKLMLKFGVISQKLQK